MDATDGRRRFLQASAFLGAGFLIAGCANTNKSSSGSSPKSQSKESKEIGGEVTATEDLMREHGVLRRALLVYTAAASQLRSAPATVPPDVLQKTAKLFRSFGEDYHEKASRRLSSSQRSSRQAAPRRRLRTFLSRNTSAGEKSPTTFSPQRLPDQSSVRQTPHDLHNRWTH